MSSVAEAAAPGPVAGAAERLLITVAIMSATLLQVLDTTIVNVALPHMQGALGANADQIAWVLTSYLVSSAIFMPLTGYLADILGRKRYLLISIAGFVASSALCGLSTTLTEIVLFRLLQGIFGASLVPLSQAIMADIYPAEQRGRAMALWGLGVMVGPILGPTLGGYLTSVASWRWTFYINLPVGILSLLLAVQFVPDTVRRRRRMDWSGFVMLAAGIACLQYMLDRGNQRDWFNALDIRIALVVAVAGFAAFIARSLMRPGRTVLDVRIFKDRNFAMACFLMAAIGLGMYGGLIIQPMLFESLLGYPILTTGLIMAPRGVATAISMLIVGRLVDRFGARPLILAGIAISAVAPYAMSHYYSFNVSLFWIIWPLFLQGLGLGMIFVPLATMAYLTLERSQTAEAAGIYSLIRTVGSAAGISVATTMLTRETQVAWNQLSAHINPGNPAYLSYAARLGLSPTDPHMLAIAAGQVARQARMTGMLDVFYLIMWSFLVMAPLMLIMRSGKASAPAGRQAG